MTYINLSVSSYQEFFRVLPAAKQDQTFSAQENEQVLSFFKEAIRDRFQTRNPQFHEKICAQLLANCSLSENELNTVAKANKLAQALIDTEITLAAAPSIFKDSTLQSGEDVTNMIKFLLTDVSLSLCDISWKLLMAILICKDAEFLDQAIQTVQTIAHKLFEHLDSQQTSPAQKKVIEVLLGNLLALVPFFEPTTDSTLILPQKIDGTWTEVTYTIERITLTPESLGSPLYAYGLKPPAGSKAHPLLLFMGTSHLTASGSFWTYWADFVPGMTIGESIYWLFGTEAIKDWLEKNASVQGAKLYGQSLGGSMSLLTASHFSEHVAEVHAYNPPAPLSHTIQLYQTKTAELLNKPVVNIYVQENDPVSKLGHGWHELWNLYSVMVPGEHNPLFAHAKAFSAQEEVVIIKVNFQLENESLTRQLLTILQQIVSVFPCFFLSLFLVLKCLACYIANKLCLEQDIRVSPNPNL